MLAILQARCTSRRLPNKVLRPILGEPMLARQIERLSRSKRISKLIVATSIDSNDAPLVTLSEKLGIACFRGPLDDVLERFYLAARPSQPRHVIRLTGDCPLADPDVIDNCIEFCLDGGYDYATNALQPTFPDGLDVEVIRFACLKDAWREARLPSEREHVTSFIYNRPERYCIGHYRQQRDLSSLRWTVDQIEDFKLVEAIYEALYPANPDFRTIDILSLLSTHPELASINADINRNEGYLKSLIADTIHNSHN